MGKRGNMNYLVVEAEGPNKCYKGVIEGTMINGKTVSPRGLETKEIRPALIIFENPRERFLTCPGRAINPIFQVLESVWILGGRGDLAFIKRYLKSMEKYADNQDEFHAPYGVRMRHSGIHRDLSKPLSVVIDQFRNSYEYLKEEPDTRHAVMSFWNPEFDNYYIKTNDRPCNTDFYWAIREEELDLTICNRSNDIHFGLFNTNVVQFSVILEVMSVLLGRRLGYQIHFTNSMHYYTDNSLTSDVLEAKYEFNVYDYVQPTPFLLDVSKSQDPLVILDGDLDLFFDWEEGLWEKRHDLPIPKYDFNYLYDVSILATIKLHLENRNTYWAIRILTHIEADDIFVTTAEYVLRSCETMYPEIAAPYLDSVRELVYSRFKDQIPASDIKKIVSFITQH